MLHKKRLRLRTSCVHGSLRLRSRYFNFCLLSLLGHNACIGAARYILGVGFGDGSPTSRSPVSGTGSW
ncbi:hypothetical protein D3C76_1750570 [compost metagenome]